MAQSILELIFRTSKSGTGGKAAAAELRELKGTVGEVTSGLLGFNAGSLTAVGAITAIGAFAKSSIDDWSAYAEEMGKAGEISGITAEDMSRITQAADDMRVPVESLKKAFELANKNGFQPSIENLADLADKVKGMNSPTERAAALSKIFGKGWADIYPLLKDGGDAIRANTAAIDDSLIVTDKAVQQNREYIKAMDDLQDSWQGVKNEAGRSLIPAVTDVLDLMNNSNTALRENKGAWDNILAGVPGVGLVYRAIIADQEAQEQATRDQGKALLDFNTSMDVGAGAAATFGTNVGNIPAKIEPLGPSLDAIKESFKALTLEMIYNKAAADLDAGAALALGRQMGLVDEATLGTMTILDGLREKYDLNRDGAISATEAAAGYTAEVLALSAGLDALDGKVIDVLIKIDKGGSASSADIAALQESGQGTGGGYGEASGYANAGWVKVPPGFPGDSYNMRLSSGEEAYVVNDRMRWTGEGPAMGGPKVEIGQVVINNEMDYRTLVARLKSDLKR